MPPARFSGSEALSAFVTFLYLAFASLFFWALFSLGARAQVGALQDVSGGTLAAYARHVARGGVTADRNCLTYETRAVLNRLEQRFGSVRVISTCRPGAVIARTRRPSYHRYGMAVDFVAPHGRKAEMVHWLYQQGTLAMTYPRMTHVHFNVGQGARIAHGGRKRVKRYAGA